MTFIQKFICKLFGLNVQKTLHFILKTKILIVTNTLEPLSKVSKIYFDYEDDNDNDTGTEQECKS